MSGDQQQPELLVDPVRVPAAGAPGPQPGPTHLAVHHLGRGVVTTRRPRAVARQPSSTPSRKQATSRIQAVEGPPVGQPEQHPAGGDAEVLLRLVALPLVDLAEVEPELAAAGPEMLTPTSLIW